MSKCKTASQSLVLQGFSRILHAWSWSDLQGLAHSVLVLQAYIVSFGLGPTQELLILPSSLWSQSVLQGQVLVLYTWSWSCSVICACVVLTRLARSTIGLTNSVLVLQSRFWACSLRIRIIWSCSDLQGRVLVLHTRPWFCKSSPLLLVFKVESSSWFCTLTFSLAVLYGIRGPSASLVGLDLLACFARPRPTT